MKKSKYNVNFIIILFPILIVIGKIIRWTILKSVLVDMSIGNGMIDRILYETGGLKSFVDTGISDAVGNASVFFRWINIFNIETTVGFEIYISIILNFILLLLIFKCTKKLELWQFTFLFISVIVLNIWDFCLAKEPVQLIFFLIIYYIIVSKKLKIKTKYLLTILVLFTTVMYYRIYYILIIAFLMIIALLCDKWLIKQEKLNLKKVIILLAILAFFYYIMLNTIKLIDIGAYNELLRVRTRSGLANTQMLNIFKSGNLGIFTVDYFLMIFRMLFPVELIPMGVKYLPYVAYQIIISLLIIKNIIHIKEENPSQRLALYLYLAFLLSSATFEPDFGSWVRHEAAIFPILVIATKVVEISPRRED